MRVLARAGSVAVALLAVGCVPPPPTPPSPAPPTTVAAPQPHWSVRDDGRTSAPPASAGGFSGSDGSGALEAAALGSAERVAVAGIADPLMSQSVLGAESVIGPDDRQAVADTTVVPVRAIALLTLDGAQLCTAFLVGPSTAVTSGHCLYGEKGFVEPARLGVLAGYDPSASPPAVWGSCRVAHAFTTVGWTKAQEAYDVGALELDCGVGERTGWLGVWRPTSPVGLGERVTGYPADRNRSMWTANGSIQAADEGRLFYDNDTQVGNSGSPVLRWRDPPAKECARWCVLAVHGYGVTENVAGPEGRFNHGVRMTRAIVDTLTYWASL